MSHDRPTARLNVGDPLGRAIEYVRRWMFRPFDFSTWLLIGVMAFLASLGQGGAGLFDLGLNFRGGNNPFDAGGEKEMAEFDAAGLKNEAESIEEWLQLNKGTSLLIGAGVAAALLVGGAFCIWLSTRAQMMLVRAVATRAPRFGENWHAVRRSARSLFWFQAILTALFLLCYCLLMAWALHSVYRLALDGENKINPYFQTVAPAFAVAAALSLLQATVSSLLQGLVTPLMYHFNLTVLNAWRHLGRIARGNVGPLALFIVIRLAYRMGFSMASMLGGCCLTCGLGLLPVVRQTLFAPFYVFDRAYSFYVLETLGPEYRMIASMSAETLPPPLPDAPPEA